MAALRVSEEVPRESFASYNSALSTQPAPQSHVGAEADVILNFGGGVSLQLLETGLLVEDGNLRKPKQYECCGVDPNTLQKPNSQAQIIPYYYILWAQFTDSEIPSLSIRYVLHTNKFAVGTSTLSYDLDSATKEDTQSFTAALLTKAYSHNDFTIQRQKRIKVLINPFGGQGKAQAIYTRHIEEVLREAHCMVDVELTKYGGHAKEIARDLDIEEWDVIACCSGDGLPYEVFNGLGLQKYPQRALGKIAVVQLPCGTGNAMCLNLMGTTSASLAALAVVKGIRSPIDLVSITQGEERYLSFLSQSLGIVAESDLGTEHMRWLGNMRFDVGFALRAFGQKRWPCHIAYHFGEHGTEDKPAIREHYSRYASRPQICAMTQKLPSDTDAAYMATTLPALKHGTVNDPIPSTWTNLPFPNLGNLYAGNMAFMAADTNFFPAALPADGLIDLILMRGDVGGFRAIGISKSLKTHTLFDDEICQYRKVEAYRAIPEKEEGYVSVDGERVPFRAWQVEVHRGLGCVLSKNGGRLYESLAP